MSRKGPIRRETLYLAMLLFTSVFVYVLIPYNSAPALVEKSAWFFELDADLGTISGCQSDDHEVLEMLERTKKANHAFSNVKYRSGQYMNQSNRDLNGCLLEIKNEEYLQIKCLAFKPQGPIKAAKQYRIYFSKESCWQNRDLHYLKNAQRLVETNSLEALRLKVQNLYEL